jgi:GT2 family glycosyltransferase
MPKVSVIIPAYNHVAYIDQCIRSVMAQTYSDYEIIVVDDGSTDGTVDVVRNYGNQITLIEQKNSGTQAARNTAIRAASGEFLALLDSDDAWLPNKLEREMEALERLPQAGLVYSLAYMVDLSGNILFDGKPMGTPISDPERAFEELVLWDKIPTLTAIMRKECLNQIGGFDETYVGAADWDMWLRIAHKWPVVCVPECLALYRIHQHNTTHWLLKTRYAQEEWMRVLNRALAMLPADSLEAEQLKLKAMARAHIYGTLCAATAADAAAAADEFSQAISFDPEWAADSKVAVREIVNAAHAYNGENPRSKKYRNFMDVFFSNMTGAAASLRPLKREALGTAAIEAVFVVRASGRSRDILALLTLGLFNSPAWARNIGLWSITVEALLGKRPAALLRRAATKLRGGATPQIPIDDVGMMTDIAR